MSIRGLSTIGFVVAAVAVCTFPLSAQNNKWNFPGLAQVDQKPQAAGAGAPAPKRDLSGIWDAGFAGIAPRGHAAAPLTPEQKMQQLIAARMAVEARLKGAASWFYWIAGLSLINSIIVAAGGNWRRSTRIV